MDCHLSGFEIPGLKDPYCRLSSSKSGKESTFWYPSSVCTQYQEDVSGCGMNVLGRDITLDYYIYNSSSVGWMYLGKILLSIIISIIVQAINCIDDCASTFISLVSRWKKDLLSYEHVILAGLISFL